MSIFELVIAESLVAADFAPDLVRGMALPGLDALAAFGTASEHKAPHAELLPPYLGWPLRHVASVDVASGWSRHAQRQDKSATGERYLLEPVHLALGTQGLILTDPQALAIDDGEAAQLIAAIAPLVLPGLVTPVDPSHWLFDVPKPYGLKAPSLEAALGQELLCWLPTGEAERAWRRLANEIQMVWHAHGVNDEREKRGLPAVNAVWLSGDATAKPVPLPYRSATGAPPWLGAWPRAEGASIDLEIITSLLAPVRNEDWSGFRNLLIGIDSKVEDALAALKSGAIGELMVIFTGREWVRSCHVRKSDLYKFWRRGKAVEMIDCPQ